MVSASIARSLVRRYDTRDPCVSGVFNAQQSGKLRMAVQFSSGTGKFDIRIHRTERVEGMFFFFNFIHTPCEKTKTIRTTDIPVFEREKCVLGAESLRFPDDFRIAGPTDNEQTARSVGDPQISGDD